MRLFPTSLCCFFCLLLPFTASSAEKLSQEDQVELDRLMGVLDKHTDIATFTKMNADYIPGMVTVLEGRDMEARGKRNVMEALTLVPGLDISLSQGGTPSMTSRGIGSPYLPATSLVLLDGVSINPSTTGTGCITFGIPIEQIERIEVIRGPGTTVNGEFAYNSVINIITRTEGNSVHASYGHFKSYSGGGIASYSNPEKEIKLSLNMAFSGTDGADHAYGPDNFGKYGNANEDRAVDSIFSTFNYHNFSLTSTYIDGGQGEFFAPYPNNKDHINSEQTVTSIEAKQLLQPMDNLSMQFKLGWFYNKLDLDQTQLAPPGFSTPALPYTYTNGVHLGVYNEEEKIFSSLESTWKATQDNTVTLALNYNYTELNGSYMMADFDPATYAPVPWQKYSDGSNFLDEDTTRNHFALALQDEYHLTEDITFIAGLRYDHYSDVEDDLITPRFSGVWQPSKHHIFKLQYAKAFRPPTFMELTGSINLVQGNEDINSETIDTYEVGYIFRKNTTIAKLTLFYSDLEELITAEPTGASFSYTNNASGHQRGFELELKQKLLNNLIFDGNISFACTEDDDTNEEVVNARNWLVNLGLTYTPYEWASINTQYRFVDERYRTSTDPRDDLQNYDILDVTLSFFPSMISGLTVRTGLKNVFGAQAFVASGEASAFYATTQAADYPVLDRFWWIQASYNF